MTPQQGGCLCGRIRFEVDQAPDWVTVCHCRFCQKVTGSAYMIEPMFKLEALRIIAGSPIHYSHHSGGSGLLVHVHFCHDCGTRLYLTFERWEDRLGVFAGAFDDPGWFEMSPKTTKHIFVAKAQRGTLIPAGYRTFGAHAATPQGVSLAPEILAETLVIRR